MRCAVIVIALAAIAGGAYEVLTVPFPAPPDDRPVIQPPYVFLHDTDE